MGGGKERVMRGGRSRLIESSCKSALNELWDNEICQGNEGGP